MLSLRDINVAFFSTVAPTDRVDTLTLQYYIITKLKTSQLLSMILTNFLIPCHH